MHSIAHGALRTPEDSLHCVCARACVCVCVCIDVDIYIYKGGHK